MELIKRNGFYWQEDIIAACKAVHGDKYDYSQVEEKISNKDDKITIICHSKDALGNEHGIFQQPLARHLKGRNCPKCSGRSVQLSEAEMIARAKQVHGDAYDYVSIDRDKSNNAIVHAVCHVKDEEGNEHGEFAQSYQHHVNGKQGCPKCRYIKSSKAIRRSLDEVLSLARDVHGDAYDYLLIKAYKNDRIPYPIRCKKHDIVFEQSFNNHICFKEGCPVCGREKSDQSRRYTQEEWIKLAEARHHGKYSYEHVDYQGSNVPVEIFCKKHQCYFKQLPTNHLFGQGCPICKESKLEIMTASWLKEHGIEFIRQKTFDWLVNAKKLSLDFYLPQYNAAIECQGKQHFGFGGWKDNEEEYKEIMQRDELKRKLCEEHGIKVYYFSNLGIEYPYKVFEDLDALLTEITHRPLDFSLILAK